MDKASRIYVAGHTGMVGSAIVRALGAAGYTNIITRRRWQLNLRYFEGVSRAFKRIEPEYIFLAAARVGGIQANIASPADSILENLAIQTAVIHASKTWSVKKLLFLGSSCMYPRDCPQPMKEEYLLTGKPEPTNQAYAISKLAGMEMCRAYRQQYGCNFITAIPCNIYGTGDHYEPERAHVVPSLIRRFVEAKKAREHIDIWGSGNAMREFMHVDDLADACLFLMEKYDDADPINVGTGRDVSICWLAGMLEYLIGGREPFYDSSKPDGAPRKLLDVSRIKALGWEAKIGLEEGLWRTIQQYREAHDLVR